MKYNFNFKTTTSALKIQRVFFSFLIFLIHQDWNICPPSRPKPPPTKTGLLFNIYFCMCMCVRVCTCIQVCFVLYVIYSQHCKHTETIIHVLALIHWIWLTWLEHHKSSNGLGWMRTQWRIEIEEFWRASGGPLKSPLLIVRLMFRSGGRQRSWWRSCHRVRKWETKSSSSSAGEGTELVLFPSSEKNRFLIKELSWLWRGWTMDQHKREAGGLFTQAIVEEDWVYEVLISPTLVKSFPIWSQCESVLVPLMVRRPEDTPLPQAVGKPKTLAQMETKVKRNKKNPGLFVHK